MYIWESQALKAYGPGWIIIDEHQEDSRDLTVDQARDKAREDYRAFLAAELNGIYPAGVDEYLDQMRQEEYDKYTALFEIDIQATPNQQDAFFIHGSD